MKSPPTGRPSTTSTELRRRAIDTTMADDDRFLKRMIKKSDAFTLGLFFFSLGLLYYFLINLYSGHLGAIALGLKLIVLINTVFLYSYPCFTDPGPEFLKVQVTVLVFCVGLLLLAMFLTRHT